MTNKEAADILATEKMYYSVLKFSMSEPVSRHDADVIEAYNMAINALRKQGNPMMVVNLKDTGTNMGIVAYCPVCGRIVDFAQRFCHNCTQSLEWPVEEILANSKDDDE